MSKSLIVLLVIILFVIGVGYWYFGIRPQKAGGGYQAVFLTNGKVYFGQLEGLNSRQPKLRQVYYLVVKPPPPSDQTGEVGGEEARQSVSYALRPLVNQIQGPTDEMVLNPDSIIYVENLRPDSPLVAKINEARAQPAQNK